MDSARFFFSFCSPQGCVLCAARFQVGEPPKIFPGRFPKVECPNISGSLDSMKKGVHFFFITKNCESNMRPENPHLYAFLLPSGRGDQDNQLRYETEMRSHKAKHSAALKVPQQHAPMLLGRVREEYKSPGGKRGVRDIAVQRGGAQWSARDHRSPFFTLLQR